MRRSLAPLVTSLVALSLAACGAGESPKPKASGGSATTSGAAPKPAPAEPAAPRASKPAPAGAGSGGSTAKTPPTAPEPAPSADAEAEGPHVTLSGSGGRAHWVGQAPAPVSLDIDPAKSVGCHEGAELDLTDRSVLVGADGGLANVVIEVVVAGVEPSPAAEPYVMDQSGCRYEPHVLAVPAGATLEYRNSDAVGHNVHTYARRNDSMNRTVAAGGAATQVYAKRDSIEVKCDIHPWMNAWVYVSEASHVVVSAADGSFALPALPPGEHKLVAWHEQLGGATGKLVVGADGAIAELDLALRTKR